MAISTVRSRQIRCHKRALGGGLGIVFQTGRGLSHDGCGSSRQQVAFRQPVFQIKRQKALVDRADGTLNQKLQPEWLCRIKPRIRRDLEQVDLLKLWRVRRGEPAQPTVLFVEKADRPVALYKLDTVEDTAAHIARSLEGIGATASNNDRLFTLFQPVFKVGVFGIAQQALADRRDTDNGQIEIDEHVFGCTLFRARNGLFVARCGEGIVDLSDRQQQSAHRSVASQLLPATPGLNGLVDLAPWS